MKILNLYAGIGGNRALWSDEHDITAVELDSEIAAVYMQLYPNDKVIVVDAHQYLLDHHKEFNFIWSSPPCPTHSRMRTALKTKSPLVYPDMKLYEEILFLEHFYQGDWVVENVKPYYTPLIEPKLELDRHYFWSNKRLGRREFSKRGYNVARATKEQLASRQGIELPPATKNQRKLLRNAVQPEIGLFIFNHFKEKTQ